MDAGDGRGVLRRPALDHRGAEQSTVRGYQNALRVFCSYVADPDYGWDRVCEQRFGTHPAQVFFAWNTAAHVQDNEQSPAKRAFTKQELQDFFDHADDQVAVIAASGRKGWLPAYRDAVMFKLAYSYGLRFNELRHLQTVDFARNPHAREFGRYGVVHVRYGKAKKGSPPKRRSVLTVFDWTPEVIADWLTHGQPFMDDGIDLFPSERGALVSEDTLLRRLRRYCNDLGLSDGLGSALVSPFLRHPSHRGRLGSNVRPAPDGPRTRQHHIALHLRVQRFPHPHPAPGARRHHQGRADFRRGGDLMKRQVDYTWRLAELMAAHGMHNSTDLIPRLAERGIELSRPQVYRVVHQRPERISLQLLAALCDIFGCGVEDLVTVTATDVRRKKAAVMRAHAAPPNVVELNKSVRPAVPG